MSGCCAALVLLSLPVIGTGCAMFTDESHARAQAPILALGQRIEDSLHCSRGICSHWYKIALDSPTRVTIEAKAPAGPALPDFELRLEDESRVVLAEDTQTHHRPRSATKALSPGTYYLNLRAVGDNGELLSYSVSAKQFTATRPPRAAPTPAAAPPPPPRAQPKPSKPAVVPTMETGLLEVEREGGEPVSVLLEAGLGEGIRMGLVGELVDSGRVIARVEVVDVYSAGSRARIVGGLSAPITASTVARIKVPKP